MANEHNQFVESMLKSAQERKKVEPQKRFDNANKQEVENFVEGIINPSKAKKENRNQQR